jgi:hypothetical protein
MSGDIIDHLLMLAREGWTRATAATSAHNPGSHAEKLCHDRLGELEGLQQIKKRLMRS